MIFYAIYKKDAAADKEENGGGMTTVCDGETLT
jgi:hypothetical protein